MSISIIIPVFNEAESISELSSELDQVLKTLKTDYEVIFIDDGSVDQTPDHLEVLHNQDRRFKWIRFRSHFGKSAALSAGFKMATGSVVVTMDGDLQDDPAEIPKLLSKLNEGYDVVSGWKIERKDPLARVLLSKIYNLFTSLASGIKLHDFNCGFKVYRSNVLREIYLYGELHRYIPLLASWRGFKIAEQRVAHRPRKHGRSKYGPERLLSGFLDLITVIFLTKFTKKPSHFFGSVGFILFVLGFLINLYIVHLRMTYGNIQGRFPLLFLGVLLTIVGIQIFSTGLIAELITFGQKKSEIEYSIQDQSV